MSKVATNPTYYQQLEQGHKAKRLQRTKAQKKKFTSIPIRVV